MRVLSTPDALFAHYGQDTFSSERMVLAASIGLAKGICQLLTEARNDDTISWLATGHISNLPVAWLASDLLQELPVAAGSGRFPDLCQDARELLRCETSFALARR